MKKSIIYSLLITFLAITAGIIVYIFFQEKGGVTKLLNFIPITTITKSEGIEVSKTSADHPEKKIGARSLVKAITHKDNSINDEMTEDGWQLVWQDEFDGRWLNPQKWNIEVFASEKNNELQYYRANNVMVKDGFLKLISKRETFDGKEYTSGAINSKDKFSFRYGKVEMKAKLPGGQGVFPAFWMMPNEDNTWLPEIDILEMLGHKLEEIWMVVHWLDEDGRLTNVSAIYEGVDYTKGFHTFGLEWTPTSISWLIDGVERFRTNKFIPDMEMYLYLNTAIGGVWPGSPDETTLFPQFFEVDYLKVYRRTGGDS